VFLARHVVTMVENEDIERFYKKAINDKKGNLFTRVDWLEGMIKNLQVRDVTNYVTQIIDQNKEIILSSVAGGTTDPTDAAFTGVVISPSGQNIGGVLYNFALVEDGVVITGWGDDGASVIVGGGDVFGDSVPSVANHAATYADTTGKHIKDSGVSIIGSSGVVGIGGLAAQNNVGGGVVAIGESAAQDNTGAQVIGIGSQAAQSNVGDHVIGIGVGAAIAPTGSYIVAIGANAAAGVSGRTVAIGYQAGAHETGSNKLFIDTYLRANEAGDRAGAIIYGVMDDDPALQELHFNADVDVNGVFTVNGSPVSGGGSQAQIMAIASIGF